MLNRAPIPALGMSDYSVCAALENQYPPFSKEFLGFDLNQDLKVKTFLVSTMNWYELPTIFRELKRKRL